MSSNFSEKTDCVICGSGNAVVVRQVPTQRTDRLLDLFCCRDCFSFFNPSGYREDEAQLKKDLEWNIGVVPRNRDYARKLFTEVKKREPELSSVLEVGCGIGTTLSVAEAEFGMKGVGFDINSDAVEWGKDNFKVDLSDCLWDAKMEIDADIITCISCLEHIEEPRVLLEQLAIRGKKTFSPVYISVPFLEVHHWKFLDDPDPSRQGTPFFDNDVHVTHFSVLGLVKAMRSFGMESFEVLNAGWMGVLFRHEPSIAGTLRAANRYRKWRAAYIKRIEEKLQSGECPTCLESIA